MIPFERRCISKKTFLASNEYNKYKPNLEPAPGVLVPDKQKSFAFSKVMHGVWATSKKNFITKTLKAKLALLHKLTMGTHIDIWGSPISHLVDRPADAQAWGDSSLFAGGAFSLDLTFW